MSAIPERAALVVFRDQTGLWWLRLLRPGFRHCFVAVAASGGWVVVDPLSHRTELALLTLPAGFDLAGHYRACGLTVIEARVAAAPLRVAPVRPYSCVEAVKRVLGIHAGWVLTPWQLYRHLNKSRIFLTEGDK